MHQAPVSTAMRTILLYFSRPFAQPALNRCSIGNIIISKIRSIQLAVGRAGAEIQGNISELTLLDRLGCSYMVEENMPSTWPMAHNLNYSLVIEHKYSQQILFAPIRMPTFTEGSRCVYSELVSVHGFRHFNSDFSRECYGLLNRIEFIR